MKLHASYCLSALSDGGCRVLFAVRENDLMRF